MRAKLIIGGMIAALLAVGAWFMVGPLAISPGTVPSIVNAIKPRAEKNIVVTEPEPFTRLGAFVTVRGRARTFENTVEFALKDGFGEVIGRAFTTANAPDVGQFGEFAQELYVPVVASPFGTVEVFWSSPDDGRQLDVVSIPVTFSTEPRKTVKVFFTNTDLDPEQTCTKVFPVEREIHATERVAAAALWELLRGPSEADRAAKYETGLPARVLLNSISIENGVARADFNERLGDGVAGSCRVQAIRAQIIETLKQFPSVRDVVISINGRTEDILQP